MARKREGQQEASRQEKEEEEINLNLRKKERSASSITPPLTCLVLLIISSFKKR